MSLAVVMAFEILAALALGFVIRPHLATSA